MNYLFSCIYKYIFKNLIQERNCLTEVKSFKFDMVEKRVKYQANQQPIKNEPIQMIGIKVYKMVAQHKITYLFDSAEENETCSFRPGFT